VSGYEVFSAGRFFYGYKDDKNSYKIFTEYGGDPKLNHNYIYIYTSDIYNSSEQKTNISNSDKKELINKIILGVKQMTKFTIVTVDEAGNETILT
jgi:hypothetical protein